MIKHKFFHASHPMQTLFYAVILIVAGVVVYSNSFHAAMVFDDHSSIIADPAIHMTEFSWQNINRVALEAAIPHRFLPNFSFAVNYYFGGLNPVGYHLVNLAIHLLTGLFLFLFIRLTLRIYPCEMRNSGFDHLFTHDCRNKPCSRFFSWACPPPTKNGQSTYQHQHISPQTIAFFAALIWIVQPVGTQAVTYIVQRMAAMAAMFYILSLLLYVKGRMAIIRKPGKLALPVLYFTGSALAALCAIVSKQSAGTLPLVILLYEWFFFQNLRLKWARGQMLWPIFFLMIFSGIVVGYMGTNPITLIMGSYDIRNFTMIERVLTQFRVIIYYLSLFFFAPPGRLNLDHDYPLSTSLFHPPTTLCCIIAITALLVLVTSIAKKERILAFCILWFFLTQAAESTIVGLELIFEHRTYIAFMMISLILVIMVFRLLIPRRRGVYPRPIDHPAGAGFIPVRKPAAAAKTSAAYSLLCAIAILFSFWTYQRNADWGNPVRFWTDTLAKSSDRQRAHQNLAFAYQQQEKWDLAISHYQKSLDMDKHRQRTDFATLANLGAALLKLGHYFDAAYYYSEAMKGNKRRCGHAPPPGLCSFPHRKNCRRQTVLSNGPDH